MALIIQAITSPDGGGAERLVRELTARLPQHGFDTRAIYFSNLRQVELSSREVSLGLSSSRSFQSVRRLKQHLNGYSRHGQKIILHAHLTWPLYYGALASVGSGFSLVYTEHSTHNRRREK